mgnify:CR=1 FL=1
MPYLTISILATAISSALYFFVSFDTVNVIGISAMMIMLAIAFVIQWLIFIPSSILQTERFYDLTGNREIKTNEDFDQTLGVYKIGTGPYIILPLIGPSSFRGMAGTILDGLVDPLNLVGTERVVRLNSTELPVKAVNTRAEYMKQINDLKHNSPVSYTHLPLPTNREV